MTVAGADWSGAGGAAALQTALQTAVNTAVGAGNATATVTGGNGSPLDDRRRADGDAHAAGAGDAARTPASRTLLGDTAVGTDGIGGRQFFTGTDAAIARGLGRRRGQPRRGRGGYRGGRSARRRASRSTSPTSRRAATGADSAYRQVIVQLGVDTQTATSRDQIQQTRDRRASTTRARSNRASTSTKR